MNQYITDVHDLVLYKMESGELNLDSTQALRNVLQEYKTNIKTIEEELQACKTDHKKLRETITAIVEENQDLNAQLKAAKGSELCSVAFQMNEQESEAVDSLKQQLDLALKEKQMLEDLWKTSLNEVNVLEEKLQDYKSGKEIAKAQNSMAALQKDYSEAIQILETRCLFLRGENEQLVVKTQMLENHLSHVMTQMTETTEKNISLNTSLKETSAREQELKLKFLTLDTKFTEIERAYQADKVRYASVYKYEKIEADLKDKLKEAIRAKNETQAALERCHELKAELLREKIVDRKRIEEAVTVSEEAQKARDEALQREAASSEEVKRLQIELRNLVEKAKVSLEQEVTAIANQYDSKLTTLKSRLDVSEQDCMRKTVEVQQLSKECERLQDLLNQSHRKVEFRAHNKELNSLYRELHSTEAECLQLRMENDSIEDVVKKFQDKCKRNNQEKLRLRRDLHMTQHQLQLCQQELTVATQRVELLNSQLLEANYKLSLLEGEAMVLERDQDHIAITDPVKVVSVMSVIELYKRFDNSFGQMNDKWKSEMSALTERIEAKLKKAKSKRSCDKEDKERRTK